MNVHKSRSTLLTTLLALLFSSVFLVSPVRAAETIAKDHIEAKMYDIDDVGLVIVWNSKGAKTISQCHWVSGNHGSGSAKVAPHLVESENYVIFVLYNKVYDGGIFFRGGKWSYNFSLEKNGAAVWTKANHVRDNSRGIKYWKILRITVSSDGKAIVSEDIDIAVRKLLESKRIDVEEKLNGSMSVARPFR